MNLTTLSTITGLITIAGGGWWAATTLAEKADKDTVLVVASKADYSIDKHAEYLLSQINKLEAKPNKTPDDRQQLQYLRDELERLRQIRRGK